MSDMRRREFMSLLRGAATSPLVARAQDRIRRIGVLSAVAENDPEARGNVTAFRQALEKLGWTDGGSVRIDYRWGGADVERIRGPFPFVVIGGLMVATTLTLVFLPALYVLWFRVKEPVAAESAVAEQVAV